MQKLPLVYINIAIRNWHALAELGYHNIYIPQPSLMHSFGLDFPVSIGGYAFTSEPDQPTVLHGTFVPTTPDQGLNQREQNRLGQKRLYEMNFDDFETRIRAATRWRIKVLAVSTSSAMSRQSRSIAGHTATPDEYNELFDPPDFGPDKGPHIAGRAQIGRISIANSDSHAYAYVNGAIDAAYRAVQEQIGL